MEKKKIWIISVLIICGLLMLCLGPLDVFSHGFYPNEIDVEQLSDTDLIGTIDADSDNSVITFSPQEDHFAGVELFLVRHNPENGGLMTMVISDTKGRQIDKILIDLSKVKNASWYKVYTNSEFRKNTIYTARFIVSDTDTPPSFLLIDGDYLGKETVDGNILISYAYARSTFSFQEKVLLFMLIIALCGVLLYFLISNDKYRKISKYIILFLILVSGMSWNFMYNSFDNLNTGFSDFEVNSETLVSGPMFAEQDGLHLNEKTQYGLGRYVDLKGTLTGYGLDYLTDDNWLCGYSRTAPAIIVNSNEATKEIAVEGNYIRFGNGDEYQISEVSNDDSNIIINLNADRTLSQARNGSLDETSFFDANHNPMDKSLISVYESQYGLHGKVFRGIARGMSEDKLANLHLICTLAAAVVFTVIVLLLSAKYNPLLAGCFYITFFLSPWVVNFARNLYWVEFTWFAPMAVGLACSIKIQSLKWRIGCYAAAFISILIKCLCGYEYISTVMMGLVSFMVVDLLLAVIKNNNQSVKLFFKATVILGIAALAGFVIAICIHARLKGNGNIADGIMEIIERDVLRRTNGADLNEYDPVYWPSMNASVWEVFCMYFHFSTEIIAGLTGNLFPVLSVIPPVVFICEFKKKKIDYQSIIMYAVFFLTSISWFCLAKSHSYIHTHMNYAMWYFGFVQICLYVIISRFLGLIQKDREGEK